MSLLQGMYLLAVSQKHTLVSVGQRPNGGRIMIVVTGTTGQLGRLVIDELLKTIKAEDICRCSHACEG